MVEIVRANRLEPREGTAIGTSVSVLSSNRVILALETACMRVRNCQEFERLPLGLQPGLHGVGECQVHIVAAEQDVLADADAFEFELAVDVGDGDQAEIGGSATDVADEDDVAGGDEVMPGFSGLRGPGVEGGLRLLQQGDVAETGGFGGFGGEASGDLIEGGGDGEDDLAVSKVPAAALFGVEECLFQVVQVALRAFEGGELALLDVGLPG